MRLFLVLTLLLSTGCTTINYNMGNELFFRCKKTIFDSKFDCKTVGPKEFKEDLGIKDE